MLPNRLNLYKTTEDELKRLKQHTGLTPNVAARLAFAISLREGYMFDLNAERSQPDGTLNLDKITWFGEHLGLYELLLKRTYPSLEGKDLERAWAAHVESGTAKLKGRGRIQELV